MHGSQAMWQCNINHVILVSNNGIKADPGAASEKPVAIRNWPVPWKRKALQ
jgi:hypothetical protein